MTEARNRKRSPIVFFLATFIAVVVIMFIANLTNVVEKVREGQLDVPGGALLKLYTVEGSLVGIAPTSKVYVWNWENLIKEPRVGSAPAKEECLIWVPGDRLFWIPSDDDETVVISDFKTNSEIKRVSLGYRWHGERLALSNNGKYVAIAVLREDGTTEKNDSFENLRLDMMMVELEDLSKIITIDAAGDNLIVESLAISDDGRFIAVVGQKKEIGWVGLVDTKNKNLLWEKAFESSEMLEETAFAPGGGAVYVGWPERFVYSFKAATGQELGKWLVDHGRKSRRKYVLDSRVRITCIAVSNDNRFLAIGKEVPPTAWVWDTKRGGKPKVIGCGNLHITDIAFSPDSALMVTTSFKLTSKTEIWRVANAF